MQTWEVLHRRHLYRFVRNITMVDGGRSVLLSRIIWNTASYLAPDFSGSKANTVWTVTLKWIRSLSTSLTASSVVTLTDTDAEEICCNLFKRIGSLSTSLTASLVVTSADTDAEMKLAEYSPNEEVKMCCYSTCTKKYMYQQDHLAYSFVQFEQIDLAVSK